MSKTPCEKLGYKVGDKFVVINSDTGLSGKFYILDEIDDAGVPFFISDAAYPSCPAIFCLEDVAKIYPDGWIEWKGGEMPVERGTLVDVKYRDGKETVGVSAGIEPFEIGFRKKSGCGRSATRWGRHWNHHVKGADIIAYRPHHEDGYTVDEPNCQLSHYPTLDDLMHAWQKAKANADTSRNILKLAEQEEAAARKALDDALRAAGWEVEA